MMGGELPQREQAIRSDDEKIESLGKNLYHGAATCNVTNAC